jgi:hypothetical protein
MTGHKVPVSFLLKKQSPIGDKLRLCPASEQFLPAAEHVDGKEDEQRPNRWQDRYLQNHEAVTTYTARPWCRHGATIPIFLGLPLTQGNKCSLICVARNSS